VNRSTSAKPNKIAETDKGWGDWNEGEGEGRLKHTLVIK